MSYFNADIKIRGLENSGSSLNFTTTSGEISIINDGGHNASNAIVLASNSGASETIEVHNTMGTGDESIKLMSHKGGIKMDASSNIVLNVGTEDVVYVDNTGNINIINGSGGLGNSINFKDSLSNIGSISSGVMDIRGNFINLEASSNVVIKSNGTQSLHFGYQDLRNDGVSGGEWKIVNTDANSNIHLVTTDTNGAQNNVMVADSYGRVGIGTVSPDSKLHLDGSIKLNANNEIYFADNGTIRSYDNNHSIVFDRNNDILNINEYGAIKFNTGTAGGDNRMTIQNDGNVGIGTDNPGEKLEVYGNNVVFKNSGNDNLLYFEMNNHSNGVDIEAINAALSKKNITLCAYGGKVGIGTSNPTNELHVDGVARIATSLAVRTTTPNGLDIAIGDNDTGLKQQGDGKLAFYTNNGERMRIDGVNVGIGTASPAASLDIRGGGNGDYVFACRTSDENGSGGNSGGFLGMKWAGSGVNYNMDVYMKDDTSPNSYHVIGRFENDTSSTGEFFTGQHRNMMNTSINETHVGLIVSSSGKIVNVNNSLQPSINESLPICVLTSIDNDKKVFGVISDKEDIDNSRNTGSGSFKTVKLKTNSNEQRIFINSLGEGAIWVCNKNGSLENGDYISSTNVPGYGGKQNDDLLHNYTVAKITCDCDFSLTKIVKQKLKVIITTDEEGKTIQEIDYDANGDVQFEDDLDEEGNQQMVYPLDTGFLLADGTILADEAEYNTRLSNGEEVYIACFVGCTYHCG
jgi:hypothetical protein